VEQISFYIFFINNILVLKLVLK